MYFRVNYRWADETVTHVRNDLQEKLFGSMMMGALDDNADDLIEPNELRGPMLALKARFADLDKDKNGGLDKTELAAVQGRRMARQVEVPDL